MGVAALSPPKIEFYLALIVSCVIAAVPMTWGVRLSLFVIIAVLLSDLSYRSPITISLGKLRHAICAVALCIVASVAWTVVGAQYREIHPSKPTSDIEVVKFNMGPLIPGEQVRGNISYHNRGSQTIDMYSRRLITVVPNFPRNSDSVKWYVNNLWNQWTKHGIKVKTKIRTEPNGEGWMSFDRPDGSEEAEYYPREVAEAAKRLNSVPTAVVIGFFQYNDDAGTHQTDYCYWYQGVPGVYITCNVHIGPEKPTPIRLND